MKLKRTHHCGALRADHVGTEVVLNGWVDAVRDHGGVVFLEMRDRYGFTQVLLDPEFAGEIPELKPEYVVAVRGEVKPRPDRDKNPDKPTGEIEVHALEVELLNTSKVPPFEVLNEIGTREELRLEYRYVDMRRRPVLDAMIFRSRLSGLIRRVFMAKDFLEVETPILMKTSPEGARDFIVPSRFRPGWVYGLPQSPQLFKQTLMVSGIDRYFQICKCFRDEDFRADRQPEFTQLDMEMSFVRQDDVFEVIEALMTTAYRELRGIEVKAPFDRITYDEAMNRYGSDKPDRRFAMELFDVSDVVSNSEFKVFQTALEGKRGTVRALVAKGGAALSRKQIDTAEGVAREYGAKGMPWVKLTAEGPTGGIAKFVTDELLTVLRAQGAAEGDLVVFSCDGWSTALTALGQVRLHLGRVLELLDPNALDLHWVTDFPLFEWNEDHGRWQAMHHMFTAPRQPLPPVGSDLTGITADLYDLVLNGNEVGSGSIRIHRPDIQRQIFEHVGISEEEAQLKFGWFLKALDYGAPPHGGIALGLDRIATIMLGAASIRDVIAFPKTSTGFCPLTESPSKADPSQWFDVGLEVRPIPETPASES